MRPYDHDIQNQVRALSLVPLDSRSLEAPCAFIAALAAAEALVAAIEAVVTASRTAAGPRWWRSLSRASAWSTCCAQADAAGSAALGWLLLLQSATGGSLACLGSEGERCSKSLVVSGFKTG